MPQRRQVRSSEPCSTSGYGFHAPEYLVEAIGGEVFEEACHPVGRHPVGVPIAGDIADPEIDKRAVTIERDVADRQKGHRGV